MLRINARLLLGLMSMLAAACHSSAGKGGISNDSSVDQAGSGGMADTGDSAAMAAAEVTARLLVGAQGAAGQWWWHYDARTGDVVERYPTYSVHQHGMAPMVLSELAAAGGTDHREAVQRGFDWLSTHPECVEPVVAPDLGVVWRKVGRREPFKAARAAGALATRVRPGARVPFVDRVWPAGRVDYECRPYELGWLLYASHAMREGNTA